MFSAPPQCLPEDSNSMLISLIREGDNATFSNIEYAVYNGSLHRAKMHPGNIR